MMAAAAGSSAREEITIPPAAQPRRGAPAGPTPTLLHDPSLHSATTIAAASTALTPESLAASLHSSVSSPTGSKLAVTTPSDSPAGGEGARITLDEEKQIALSQLQELEVAIKVRKVTKVDGRKIRWIEYRARKQAEEQKQPANAKKRPRRSRSKTKGVENSENEANVNNNNNNTNNNNNNNKADGTMKGDATGSPLSAVGTSNVLESMKQQFLQGTENAEAAIVNGKTGILAEGSGQKRKSGRNRKSNNTSEGGSPSSTSPKKLNPSEASPKGAARSLGVSKGSSSTNSSISEGALSLASFPITTFNSDLGIKKNFFMPRSLTKGLREVRKMENGTVSDGASPGKTEEVKSPVSSPSTYLLDLKLLSSLVPVETNDPKPQPVDNKAAKTPSSLIKASAKLMSPPTSRSKSADAASTKSKKGTSQKGGGKKASKSKQEKQEAELKKTSKSKQEKQEAELKTTINGHNQTVQNGSKESSPLISAGASSLGEPGSGKTSKQGNKENSLGTPSDADTTKRKPRGRPPKRKVIVKKKGNTVASSAKSGKKLATLVVDVHNTMNGEPQMVIPVSRPVLRGKKKAASKKSSKSVDLSTDIKRSPAPPSKRQKLDVKVKVEAEDSTISDGETKKSKAGKKNAVNAVVITEEKDDTSASTTNQIQTPPDQTQSTKHTKSVQKMTNKEVPSESGSSVVSSSNASSNKKKKVKKPTLKVKTLPAKNKEIKKIVNKSKKAASGGVKKQNKTQPKKNTIRKYLCVQKKKAPKSNSSNKKESAAQVKPKNRSDEVEVVIDGITPKVEQDTADTEQMEVQVVAEQPSLDTGDSSRVLKTESTEMEVQSNVPALDVVVKEDQSEMADVAAEVPSLPSSTVLAGGNREESSVEMNSGNTTLRPKDDVETQPPTQENSTAVDILGIDKSFEKVSDLPQISFQKNDNINNNNTEEEGVVICDKEIKVVKDLSSKKLSTTDEVLKCIGNEECSLDEYETRKKKGDTVVSEEKVETVPDQNKEKSQDEEPQVLQSDSGDVLKKDSSDQNCLHNNTSCEPDLKSEENVCDKSEVVVEKAVEGGESLANSHTLPGDEREMQSNSTLENSVTLDSSNGGIPKDSEVPLLDSVPCPAISQSTPDNTTAKTAAQGANVEAVEEVIGSEKIEESQSDTQDKESTEATLTTEVTVDVSEATKTKENDPTENNVSDTKTAGNQTDDCIKPSDDEPQVAEVQKSTVQDANPVALVSQKSSPKPVKRRDIPAVRRKVKKGLMQAHIVAQLEQSDDVLEEEESNKDTKAQEASQEAGAGKTSESNEVVEDLPRSQKEEEVQEMVPEVQPVPLPSAPEVQSSSTTKTKDKVPRILKQLFQDEGVQNMLKSMGEDTGVIPETSPNSDSGTHKLRPKRITEPMLSSSPELDAMEAIFTSSRKKKRGSEVDSLYSDEGVLNLLTSKEHPTRRGHQDDVASDISQATTSKSFKSSKTTKSVEVSSDTRKRKLSGASTASNSSTSSKSLQPPEPKKVRVEGQEVVEDPYELDSAEEFRDKPVIVGYSTLDASSGIANKKGAPHASLSVKPKYKAVRMHLKVPKQLKSIETNTRERQEAAVSSVVQVPDPPVVPLEVPPEVVSLPASVEVGELSSKSVPPIKIKLASDSVTIKPVPRSPLPPQPTPGVTILPKPAPPVRLPIRPQVIDVTNTSQPRPLVMPRPQLQPQRQTQPQPQPQPQVRISPDKPRPQLDHPSPSSSLPRRVEIHPAPVQSAPVPPAPAFPSLVRNCDPAVAAAAVAAVAAASRSRQRVGGESVRQSQRASVRQSEANYHFRDISLRKFNNFTQIILSPSTTKMKNSLNSRVLRELCEALNTLKRDESVRIVLLTGTGTIFCQGVDLTALQHPNLETRKKNAENLVRGIKDFLKALVQFPKPIIAGVNGNAMGLGVTMLPLFDMVIANDKAEFCLPYAKLGQVPEGGATYTFPNLCGKLQSTQLFLGHKLTANRAQEIGLVSESIWPATYQQELIPKVALLATQSAQSMEATKALMNHHLVTKLELSLESECRLLLQQWTSPHFAHLCKRFLETQYIHLQKPVTLPL